MTDQELLTKFSELNTEVKQHIQGEVSSWKQWAEQRIAQGAPESVMNQIVENVERRLGAQIETRLATIEQEMGRSAGNHKESLSLGEFLTSNPDTKQWMERQSKVWTKSSMQLKMDGGSFFLNADGSPRYMPSYLEQKTTITSAAVGSGTAGVLMPMMIPGIVKPGVRRVRVRDLMPRFATIDNAVFYVGENAFTNAASPTAETISKPESALTFTVESETVRTIAHTIPAARQVLADFRGLPAYINQRLLEGLKDVEDNELLSGDGTGQHLSGLSNEATAYDTGRDVASDTRIDKLNHAVSQIEDALQQADGIILHPRDWRAVQLIKEEAGGANTGPYILGGPRGDAEPFLWGLPIATTTAVSVGTFFVGAFQQYCQVWDRMEATVDVSNEHWDFFIKNMVMIRAEERLAFIVLRADAVIFGVF